ncbi:MAG: DegV family protein [Anaerolineae bacterium]|nr:DegV family protein [Anaerolineae bacterium]
MIKIVTDTLSDLPQEIVDQYNICLIPLHINFGQEVYRDRFDISGDEFFRRLASAPQLPTTSSPSVGDFLLAYQSILADDPETIILSIHIAGTLSGTITSARQAVNQLTGANIHIFDTLSGSLGEGLMVQEAGRMALEDAPLDDILSRLAAMRAQMQMLITPSSLDYLAKGGRIGRAAHLVGTLLDIKPVLRLTGGIFEPIKQLRTHKRAVAALRDLAIEDARGKPGLHLAVGHGEDEEAYQWLAGELLTALQPEMLLRGGIGAVIGTHLGPGVAGTAWWFPG